MADYLPPLMLMARKRFVGSVNTAMNAEQNDICQFLKSWPGQFVSRKEICRRAGGKWRYREDENWAVPVLQRMLENRLIESDGNSHYRLMKYAPLDPRNKRRFWISPAIRSILEKSGRNFPVIELDKEVEAGDLATIPDPASRYEFEDQNRIRSRPQAA